MLRARQIKARRAARIYLLQCSAVERITHWRAPECLSAPIVTLVSTTWDSVKENQPAITPAHRQAQRGELCTAQQQPSCSCSNPRTHNGAPAEITSTALTPEPKLWQAAFSGARKGYFAMQRTQSAEGLKTFARAPQCSMWDEDWRQFTWTQES